MVSNNPINDNRIHNYNEGDNFVAAQKENGLMKHGVETDSTRNIPNIEGL